jgi:hypothetical protein
LANWINGNEKIDNFIQEMQLKIDDYNDIVFEWIPYNQFSEIKETGKNDFITVYSAMWKDGPLYYNRWNNEYAVSDSAYLAIWKDDCNRWGNEYIRDLNKKVALKYLHNSRNSVESLINEV